MADAKLRDEISGLFQNCFVIRNSQASKYSRFWISCKLTFSWLHPCTICRRANSANLVFVYFFQFHYILVLYPKLQKKVDKISRCIFVEKVHLTYRKLWHILNLARIWVGMFCIHCIRDIIKWNFDAHILWELLQGVALPVKLKIYGVLFGFKRIVKNTNDKSWKVKKIILLEGKHLLFWKAIFESDKSEQSVKAL